MNKFPYKFIVSIFFISLLVLLTGVMGRFLFVSSSGFKTDIIFPGAGGEQVKGSIFLPPSINFPHHTGGVIIAHGVVGARDLVEPMAFELSGKGIAVLTYDTPYISDDKNEAIMRSAVRYLRARAEIDPQKIALMGHSMGGRTAANIAEEEKVKAVVSIGMSVYASAKSPSNLLMISGLYDELHPPVEMLDALIVCTDGFSETGKVRGDYSKGEARMLYISPAADHVSEIFDPAIVEAIGGWIFKAFDIAPEKTSSGMYKIQFVFLIYAGAFGLFFAALLFFNGIFFKKIFLRIIPGALIVVFLAVKFICMSGENIACEPLLGRIFFILSLAVILSNYLIQSIFSASQTEFSHEIVRGKILRTLLYFCAIYFSFQVIIIISALPFLIVWPVYLEKLPLFIWRQITLGGYYMLISAARFFTPSAIEGIVIPIITLGLETAFPGAILGIICKAAGKLPKFGFRKSKSTPAHFIIFTVLLLAAIFAWLPWVRSPELDWSFLYPMLKLCVKFFILPFALIYAVISTNIFKKMDSHIKKWE